MKLPKKIGIAFVLCFAFCLSAAGLSACKDKDKDKHGDNSISAVESVESVEETESSSVEENTESTEDVDSESSSETIEEHTHVWVETQNSVAATCEKDGIIKLKCECGEEKSETATALGHEIRSFAAKTATCTQNGWNGYEECARCEYTTYEEIPAAHRWAYGGMLKEPSCVEQGIMLFLCESCGQGKYELNPAFGHDLRSYAAKPAACGEEGWAAYEACTRCSYTTKNSIAALEHVWDEGEIIKEPSCLSDGVKEYSCIRSDCDEKKTETLVAKGHNLTYYAGRVVTCEEDGCNAYEECSDCGYTTKVVTPRLGHLEQTIEGVAATCENEGMTEGKYCTRCNKTTVERVPVPALGHQEVAVEGEAPTCEADGYTAHMTCERCDWNTKEEISATGHTEKVLAAIEKTCEQDGLEEGLQCSVCEKVLKEQKIIPATGHDERLRGEQAATCLEDGQTGEKYCVVCGKVLQENQTINAKGHTMVVDTRVDATCTTEGKEYGIHCGECGEILLEPTVIPAAHVWNDGVFSEGQSCEDGGVITYTCTKCGAERFEDIEAQEHQWDEGKITRQANCKQEGEKTFTCFCGKTKAEIIEKTEHQEKAISGKTATCTMSGYTASVVCSICNEILKAATTIQPLGHKMQAVAGQESTCEVGGWTSGETCERCKTTTVQTLTAKGHDYVGGACKHCGKQQNDGAVYELSADGTYYICTGRASTQVKELVILDEYNGKPVKEIHADFSNCGDLNSVTIGKNVTKIKDYAFYQCYNLWEVYNYSSLSIQKGSMEHGCIAQYAKDVYMVATQSKIQVDENGFVTYVNGADITLIGYRGTQTDLTLPQNITAISRNVFASCTGVKRVVISDSITTLKGFVFENCATLEEVVIGNGVKTIEMSAFKNVPALRSVIFTNDGTWDASNGTTSVTLKANILMDPSVAATYLSKTYMQYEWTRE